MEGDPGSPAAYRIDLPFLVFFTHFFCFMAKSGHLVNWEECKNHPLGAPMLGSPKPAQLTARAHVPRKGTWQTAIRDSL